MAARDALGRLLFKNDLVRHIGESPYIVYKVEGPIDKINREHPELPEYVWIKDHQLQMIGVESRELEVIHPADNGDYGLLCTNFKRYFSDLTDRGKFRDLFNQDLTLTRDGVKFWTEMDQLVYARFGQTFMQWLDGPAYW